MKKLIGLGIAHGLNDCIAGYLLGMLLHLQLSLEDIGIAVLVYNVIAFGGQLVFAYMITDVYKPAMWLRLCFGLMLVSISVFNFSYHFGLVASGIASVIIHVVGGYESSREHKSASGLGIFASPGVMGLVIGGYLAYVNLDIRLAAGLLCIAAFVCTWFISLPPEKWKEPEKAQDVRFDEHDVVMIVLLTIIALRSAVWNIFQLFFEDSASTLVWLGAAAMLGKLAGGYLGDKLGHRRYTLAALALSIPFLTLMKQSLWSLGIGIFFLQSTFPVTTRLLINSIRGNRLAGVAVSFGMSILLGGVIFFTPLRDAMAGNMALTVLLIFSILLMLFLMRRNKAASPGREEALRRSK